MTPLQGERRAAWHRDASRDGAAKAMPLGPSASSKGRLGKGTGIAESPLLSGLYLLPRAQQAVCRGRPQTRWISQGVVTITPSR